MTFKHKRQYLSNDFSCISTDVHSFVKTLDDILVRLWLYRQWHK